MSNGSERAGFTLLELMVVVAILMVLAALILPGLSNAKAAAKRIQCVSQLRQLGLAAQMYWEDHGGAAFHYKGVYTNGGDVYWFGWLERGGEGDRDFDPSAGALYPYLRRDEIGVCPSLEYQSERFKFKAKGAAYGYGYNTNLSASLSEPPVRIEQVRRPSDLCLLADAAQVNTFQYPASPSNPMLEEFYYVSEAEPTTHFRHVKKANVLFCDGHVEREQPVIGSLDARLSREYVGRLRVEILRWR